MTILARSGTLAVNFSVVALNCALITSIWVSVNFFWVELIVDDGDKTCFLLSRYCASERTLRFLLSSDDWDSLKNRDLYIYLLNE